MISIIVAIAKNNVIGKGNLLPWHYKEDMRYFKNITSHHKVIMGEQTFESILSYTQKTLPNRTSVIATLDDYTYPGVDVTHDLFEYLKNIPFEEEVFIIGGKTIYDLTLDLADRLYITHIDKAYEGDVFFKEIDYSKYTKIKETIDGELRFAVYERIR